MVMLRILRRHLVVVVIVIIIIPGECMMRAAIRHPTMRQSHMPGGKEPPEQK